MFGTDIASEISGGQFDNRVYTTVVSTGRADRNSIKMKQQKTSFVSCFLFKLSVIYDAWKAIKLSLAL